MKKGWIIGIAVVTIVVGFFLVKVLPALMFASGIPDPGDVPLPKEEATKLVQDFEAYGKIHELDDFTRHSKSINGITIRMTEKESDYGKYYKEVLAEQGIEPEVLENFRSRLEETKLREYQKYGNYSVFIVDGMFDSVWGYVYVHGNESIPDDYFEIDGYTIKAVEDLGDNWYRFGGS